MQGMLGVGRVDLVCIRAITRCWATRLALLSGLSIVPIELHLAPIQLQISSNLSPFLVNPSANLAPISLYSVSCQVRSSLVGVTFTGTIRCDGCSLIDR